MPLRPDRLRLRDGGAGRGSHRMQLLAVLQACAPPRFRAARQVRLEDAGEGFRHLYVQHAPHPPSFLPDLRNRPVRRSQSAERHRHGLDQHALCRRLRARAGHDQEIRRPQPISPPMDVPVLETERLRLRAHSVDDFPALKAMWSEEAVTHYIGGKPMRSDECWTRLLRYRGLWPLLGYGYWAVEEKTSGRFVGDLGFADFHRLIEPSIRGIPEMGWVIAPEAHGKGY